MDFEKYTERARGFVQSAQSLALTRNHQKLTPEHLLKALIDDEEGLAGNVIKRAGGDPQQAETRVETALGKLPRVEGSGAGQLHLTPELARVFEQAEKLAKKAGDSYVTVERLLMALAMETKTDAAKALKDAGVTPQNLESAIQELRAGRTADTQNAEDQYEALDKYTIDQAVKDNAVVPLLYEGREVVQDVNRNPIDTYFDMISEPLSDYQKTDLKKKFSRSDQLNEAEQKIHRIAWDVSLHFQNEWQNTGFKGQLTAPNKKVAVKYKKFFDEIGLISTELLISGTDTREGFDSFYEEPDDEVLKFWQQMMHRYGSEKQYNKQVINAFKKSEKPEVIIVVDKLLTGFDAPRNVVLYITRSLKEHSLLQAIARVNRVFEGKDYGFIIDYYGILGELDQALNMYSSLSEFDEEDLEGTLTSVREEINKLPEKHSQLWDIFKTIENKQDEEAYEQLLADQKVREEFYDRLSSFNRTLKIALSTREFIEKTPEKIINTYKSDAKFFQHLRISVKRRYSDEVDYKQYEKQIQKLIDTHITSDEVMQLTDQVNIFEQEKFAREVEKIEGKAAKADTIASRTKKTIHEKMDEDPVFYKKLSKLLEEAIDDWRQRRISDTEYLNRVMKAMQSAQKGSSDNVPDKLKNKDVAQAFYRTVDETLKKKLPKEKGDDLAAEIGLKIDDIINKHKIVDWQSMEDIKNRMSQDIEDYLFSMKEQYGLDIGWNEIDKIIEKTLGIAEKRY